MYIWIYVDVYMYINGLGDGKKVKEDSREESFVPRGARSSWRAIACARRRTTLSFARFLA